MKRILPIFILLIGWGCGLCATPTFCADADTGGRASLSVEASLSAGLNGFSPRGAQLAAVAGLSFGRYISVSGGLGVRHAYALASIDRNIHGYGEPDQPTYGDRFLLPLFVRVQGCVPVARFGWAGASFLPFARLDVGYAVDLQQSLVSDFRPDAGGPFLVPAAGLDVRMQDGTAWLLAIGVGIHAAQYVVHDHSSDLISHATGNAVSLSFILGRRF